MQEIYALVIWFMADSPRHYNKLTFDGSGRVVEVFQSGGDPAYRCDIGGMSGLLCSRARSKCIERMQEIEKEIEVADSLIRRNTTQWAIKADKPWSLDCLKIEIDAAK